MPPTGEPLTEHLKIVNASSQADISSARSLFEKYAHSLTVSLDFQDFQRELSNLPGKYAPPRGAILLAKSREGDALGCVALRPLDFASGCEMKRLFVQPSARASGIGPALSQKLIQLAKEIGYQDMYLDTLPSMKAAQALYTKLGFKPTEPYYETPVPETLFMKLNLSVN